MYELVYHDSYTINTEDDMQIFTNGLGDSNNNIFTQKLDPIAS